MEQERNIYICIIVLLEHLILGYHIFLFQRMTETAQCGVHVTETYIIYSNDVINNTYTKDTLDIVMSSYRAHIL
jgi:hypothetical protein